MTLSEFVRIYPLRAKTISWFFGAGTSVSAGLPTASDLVWEFKKRIYCSEEGLHLSLFSNLSDPAIRAQIQNYFNSKEGFPVENSIEEYSFYFEKAFSSPRDRADYLASQLRGMQNSYGHKVIGVLMKNNIVKVVFTTNFDKAFENAAIDQLKTMDKIFVASMDNAHTSLQIYKNEFRPFIAKIHGDYFSEKLKNTTEELQSQDAHLREILFHSCLSNGLAIMGYSGRDQSVMEALDRALEQPASFPHGIFWFSRQGSRPLPEVRSFLDKARAKGIQAEIVEIETFDTAWADIFKAFPDLPAEDVAKLNENYFRRVNNSLPDKGNKDPIIRLNAIDLVELPSTARLFKCDAGNTKEIRDLIASKGSSLIAIRKQQGVVGFGPDEEFDAVFEHYGQGTKDVFQIPDSSLAKEDSTIKGLLTEALIKAIVAGKPLINLKRKERYLLIPDPKHIDNAVFETLKREIGQSLTGKITNTNIQYIIALEVLLQKKLGKHFVVLSPTVRAAKSDSPAEKLLIAPFVKEYTATWYNSKYAKIFDAWLDVIFGKEKELLISAFDSKMIGFNAQYRIKRQSPFTKTA